MWGQLWWCKSVLHPTWAQHQQPDCLGRCISTGSRHPRDSQLLKGRDKLTGVNQQHMQKEKEQLFADSNPLRTCGLPLHPHVTHKPSDKERAE